MADPTHPATPAPDDSWPAPDDAAVRRIVEALTAEATPEELGDEARYVAAFEALTETSATPAPDAAGARRRGRVVLVAAVAAALAVTGTAAAVTGTIHRNAPPAERPPATTSLTAPVTPASGPATETTHPPTSLSPRPTSEPGTTPSPRPTPTPSSRSTSSPSRPTATPSPSSSAQLPPTAALRAWCRSYLRGKVEEDSEKYRTLAEAAGGPDRITAYCTALVAGKSSP